MSGEYLDNKVLEKTIHSFQHCKKLKGKLEIILEDLKSTDLRKKSLNKKHKTSEILLTKIEDYDRIHKEFNDIKAKLAISFYLLAENLTNWWGQFTEVDPEDAIQEGVAICLQRIDQFDKNKGKAFNYMTTCIINHFRQLYRTARNHNELKKKYNLYLQEKVNAMFLRKTKHRDSSFNQGGEDDY